MSEQSIRADRVETISRNHALTMDAAMPWLIESLYLLSEGESVQTAATFLLERLEPYCPDWCERTEAAA